MYKHLLLPIDAGEDTRRAVREGLKLARSLQARVTLMAVRAPFGALAIVSDVTAVSPADHAAAAKADADQGLQWLKEAAEAARQAGVACEAVDIEHESASAAIVETAAERGCDLIVQPAPGRQGVTAWVLGDLVTEVIEKAEVPVLIVR